MALPSQLKIVMDAYWAEDIEPYVRHRTSKEEVFDGLYSFSGEAERLMSEGGYSYGERDAAWAYLESLATQYCIDRGFIVQGTKPAVYKGGRILSPGMAAVASIAAGVGAAGLAFFAIRSMME